MIDRIRLCDSYPEHTAITGSGTAQLHWSAVSDTEARIEIELDYCGAYGMGEKFNALNQKGFTSDNQVVENFCYQGENTYCSAPFFFTDSGLGLYVATPCRTVFSFGETIVITCPTDVELVLFHGSPEEILRSYMSLFGAAKLPPKWAFGPWISANHWSTQAQVENQLELLRQHDFPATVLVVEAWSDEATFYIFNGAQYTPVPDGKFLRYEDFDFGCSEYWQNPKEMIAKLHDAGVHLVLWQIPVYKLQGADEVLSPQNELDRADAVQSGLVVRNSDGTPYAIPEGHWFSGSYIPDFTNDETVKKWFDKRRYLLDIGVDGFKTDGGEFIYSTDVCFADGSTGAEGKNLYSQHYTAAYTKFIGSEHVLFSRAGFAGQHTTPIHWGGDQQSTNAELGSVLKAGLSAALTGIPFWGFDIAGFAGSLPTPDLYRRATQLACFTPVMQWHSEPDGGQFKELMPGGEGNNERSPWNLAAAYSQPELIDEMRFWHNLRMNLLPYIYSTALDCVTYSRPMMRPLVYNWGNDASAIAAEDEFLLGDSLLVAPLLVENALTRQLYLPAGRWHSLFSRIAIEGGCQYTSTTEDCFPVFLREGHGIALNLSGEKIMGDRVGNSVDSYQNLHMLLAGRCGSYHFRDDLGNDFTVTWTDGEVCTSGNAATSFSWEIINGK